MSAGTWRRVRRPVFAFLASYVFLGVLCAAARAVEEVAACLEEAGPSGGIVVLLGCEDIRSLESLRADGRFVVQGLDRDPAFVDAAHDALVAGAMTGGISIRLLEGDRLPYADDLVNIVIVNERAIVSEEEITRVLAPRGTCWYREGGEWKQRTKPWPDEIDEWTHFLHDASGNPVASDLRVGPPRRVQWKAGPSWGRSHEFNSSMPALVSGAGRLFYVFDEGVTGLEDPRLPERWTLIARDAFNGSLLWRQELPGWGSKYWKSRALRFFWGDIARRLVVFGDALYFTPEYGGPIVVLDGATGNRLRTVPETSGANEILIADDQAFTVRIVSDGGREQETLLTSFRIDDDKILWHVSAEAVTPQSLAIGGDALVYRGANKMICRERGSGAVRWETDDPMPRGAKDARGMLIADTVAIAPCKKGLVARSLEDGEIVWEAAGPRGGSMQTCDLFAVDGAVWCSAPDGQVVGYDLATGEEQALVDASNVQSPGHHLRCYRAKATEEFLITQFRGAEFVSIGDEASAQHDWLRGACTYGIMPANGFLYAPPHSCFCYTGAMNQKLSAFRGACDTALEDVVARAAPGPVLRGSAFRSKMTDKPRASDWPMYRHDVRRTGAGNATIPVSLGPAWERKLGAELTPPILADGLLIVVAKDKHAIHALDARTGKTRWTFAATGRIDSPPSCARGCLLFGSADGSLYALRLSDGALIWKRRLAPAERWIAIDGQLESAWPLHGSVAVVGDLAYTVAGRSTFVDGGLFFYAVDIASGEIKHQSRVATIDNTRVDWRGNTFVPSYHMEGSNSDLLVVEGGSVYLGQMRFSMDLEPMPTQYLSKEEVTAWPSINLDNKPYVNEAIFTVTWRDVQWDTYDKLAGILVDEETGVGEHAFGRHLFTTSGFLDTSYFNRTFWMYSNVWPGFNHSNLAPKSGQLVVIGPEATYALKAYTSRYALSPRYDPQTKGYLLVADDNENDPTLDPRAWAKDKGMGFSRGADPRWHRWLPIRVVAMALGDENLVVCGPPDVVDSGDPLAAFEGRMGSKLQVISAESGSMLGAMDLEDTPIFDGMIAADGHVFLCTEEGCVVCLEAKE